MRSLLLVPEALVAGTAILLLLGGQTGFLPRSWRGRMPAVVAGVVVVAFIVELWVGGTVSSLFGGGFIQDRFALFAKAAVLLAVVAAIAVADWTAEDSTTVGISMALLAAFGVMVVASAGDFVPLWAGLELAGAAGVVLVGLRRPDIGLRLLIVGGIATALFVTGFAFVYATAGTADLMTARQTLANAAPTLPLAIPVLLLFGGLAVRAGIAPFHIANVTASLGASPLGSGIMLGLAGTAALIAAIKVAAVLTPVSGTLSPYLEAIAAVAMVGGGAAALGVRAPRARLAYLAVGQAGWVVAGLATHYLSGLGGSLFLVGAFVLAATCGPVVLAGAEGGEASLAGLGAVRPARALGIAMVFLSLAGAPPLAGFFGEFAVAAALAQGGHFGLLALGLLGSVLSAVAVLGTLRVLYLQSPPEEGRRAVGVALPTWTLISSAGAIAIGIVMVAYGALANPILSLAYQGAEALGLR
ncbi:MAG TPA: proton-conducting transporter membrane subunit [Candidatus Micrarchaeaceae archaeon]|nr:proton-conducting transporter membrane subunit [Candidatus Micrarchaeaceae archaeon]